MARTSKKATAKTSPRKRTAPKEPLASPFPPPRTRQAPHKLGYHVQPVGAPKRVEPFMHHQDVRRELHRSFMEAGFPQSFTEDEVQAAVAKVDQHAILQKHRDAQQIVVWDQKSPINDAPAKKVLAELDHEYDAIYLIVIDGVVTVFQPHEPFVEGIQPLKEGSHLETWALRHVEQIARRRAAADIIQEARKHLGVEEPPPRQSRIETFEDDEVPGLGG